MSRANAYEIPSALLALHFARKREAMHEIWFAHPYTQVAGPVCRRCGKELTADMWAAMEECEVGR